MDRFWDSNITNLGSEIRRRFIVQIDGQSPFRALQYFGWYKLEAAGVVGVRIQDEKGSHTWVSSSFPFEMNFHPAIVVSSAPPNTLPPLSAINVGP